MLRDSQDDFGTFSQSLSCTKNGSPGRGISKSRVLPGFCSPRTCRRRQFGRSLESRGEAQSMFEDWIESKKELDDFPEIVNQRHVGSRTTFRKTSEGNAWRFAVFRSSDWGNTSHVVFEISGQHCLYAPLCMNSPFCFGTYFLL